MRRGSQTMNKLFVDTLIKNMKSAGVVAKVLPWSFEGYGDKQKSVRYVGLKLDGDWLEIFSPQDNLLIKFVIDRTSAYLDYYLANKPPFVRIMSTRFSENDKWEVLFGECKRKMKKAKSEYISHTDSIDNLYGKIVKDLKV